MKRKIDRAECPSAPLSRKLSDKSACVVRPGFAILARATRVFRSWFRAHNNVLFLRKRRRRSVSGEPTKRNSCAIIPVRSVIPAVERLVRYARDPKVLLRGSDAPGKCLKGSKDTRRFQLMDERRTFHVFRQIFVQMSTNRRDPFTRESQSPYRADLGAGHVGGIINRPAGSRYAPPPPPRAKMSGRASENPARGLSRGESAENRALAGHARAYVSVWVRARVGDAVARDTTVTFETRRRRWGEEKRRERDEG